MRIVRCLAVGFALAAFAGGARGNGFIERTGATITLGSAPDQGTLSEDSCAIAGPAPVLPAPSSLGTIGAPPAGIPPFPAAGASSGTDGAFVATASQTLAGRTFDFTSFTVNAGVEVTYSSEATIRTLGDVSILGTVTTNSAGTPIAFSCAGDFTLGGSARVRALGTASGVTIDVGRSFASAINAGVDAADGNVEISTHGLASTSGDIALAGTALHTAAGLVSVRAAGAVTVSGASLLRTQGGNVLVQAFGGDVSFGPGSAARASGTGAITIDASRGATFTDVQGAGSQLDAADTGLRITAFGGDVEFVGEAEARSAGDVLVGASGNVRVAGRSQLVAGLDLTVTAFDGGVTYEPTDDFAGLAAAEHLAITALRDVVVSGVGRLISEQTIDVRALGGGLSMTSGIGVSAAGAVVILAGGEAGLDLGGAKVEGSRIDVLALGAVTIGGAVDAQSGGIMVTAWFLGIDLKGASFQSPMS